MAHEGLQRRIQQQRWISLGAGVACFFALLALWAGRGDPAFGSARYVQVFGFSGLARCAGFWCLWASASNI